MKILNTKGIIFSQLPGVVKSAIAMDSTLPRAVLNRILEGARFLPIAFFSQTFFLIIERLCDEALQRPEQVQERNYSKPVANKKASSGDFFRRTSDRSVKVRLALI